MTTAATRAPATIAPPPSAGQPSNSAERAVKGPKRHQAVSGYWHTQHTLGRWCRIRSYLDSAANHGLTTLDAITGALDGRPWLAAVPVAA